MVVKLSVAALYADVYPTHPKARGRQMDCAAEKRQKLTAALPALVEDDSEVEAYEQERERSFLLRPEDLRRQKSISPQRRERLRRHLALPSLSEDEEP